MTPKVLVVEDEDALMTLLVYNLESEGYQVAQARDGEEALLLLDEEDPDLVLLDWMLPQVSGIEVCRRIRARKEKARTPVIMLTARGEETDRVRGLDTGADDYISKPFSTVELMARIRAVLRRTRPALVENELGFGDILIDKVTHRVKQGTREVHLGPTEYRLLEVLLEHPGRVYPREQLLDRVWGSEADLELRTVDVHIGRLRKALKREDGKNPIRTVRSAGYALDETYA